MSGLLGMGGGAVGAVVQTWTSFRKFELEFDAQAATIYTRDHAEIPIFAVSLYLLMVFQLPLLLPQGRKLNLRPVVAVWNGILAVFSTIGFFRVGPVLLYHIRTYGLKASICTDPYYWYRIGPAGLWMTLFVYSKIPGASTRGRGEIVEYVHRPVRK